MKTLVTVLKELQISKYLLYLKKQVPLILHWMVLKNSGTDLVNCELVDYTVKQRQLYFLESLTKCQAE